MSIKENTKTLSFKIGENFASDFDELINIEIQNRKSDIGFTEFNNMTIKMRPGTVKVGDTLTGTGGISKQFFFIDFYKKIHHIKGYNKKVWRLATATWTDLGPTFTSNNFTFTPMLLPMMLDGTIPTEYTNAADSTGSERIKKAASDTGGATNIGKYLIITDNSANAQAYRGAFASILDYDLANTEYTLNGAGVTTILKSGAKYQIYDTLGEHLEVTNGAEYERFFFGKSDGTLVENTKYTGLSTLGLRLVKAILDTDFILKQVSYDNTYWTFNKNTLYYTAGALNNPFLYNFTTVLSVPGSISGYINDLFVFKNKLIIGGSNYVAYFQGPTTSLTAINMISSSYGALPGSFADVGVDGYFVSTNKHIYSIKEQPGTTVLIPTDEGKTIRNYLKNFNYNVIGAFDGSKLYFYGEEVSGEAGIIVVLDIQFKFWSIYTGLTPSAIMFNEGIIYLSDNNSDTLRKFDDTVETDNGVAIIQKVSLKDISGGLPFILKSLVDVYLRLDNYAQNLTVGLYMANPGKNTRKSLKTIILTDEEVNPTSDPMGEGVIGEGILGGIAVDENISLPIMKKLEYEVDDAVLWKIILQSKNGQSFYLNQMDISISVGDGEYFSVDNCI